MPSDDPRRSANPRVRQLGRWSQPAVSKEQSFAPPRTRSSQRPLEADPLFASELYTPSGEGAAQFCSDLLAIPSDLRLGCERQGTRCYDGTLVRPASEVPRLRGDASSADAHQQIWQPYSRRPRDVPDQVSRQVNASASSFWENTPTLPRVRASRPQARS